MTPHEERLAFILDFVQKDLGNLRPGEFVTLQDDLFEFAIVMHNDFILTTGMEVSVYWEGWASVESRGDPVQGRIIGGDGGPFIVPYLSQDQCLYLQARFRPFLRHILSLRDLSSREQVLDMGLQGLDLNFTASIRPIRQKEESIPPGLLLHGSQVEVVCALVFLLLITEPMDKFRACPECQTLFVRVRKQQYCTSRCAQRVAMRRYRETSKGKKSTAKASRDHYARKTRAKPGLQKVKIRRNQPRSTQKSRPK